MRFEKLFFTGLMLIFLFPANSFAQSHDLADKYHSHGLSLQAQNRYLEAARMYEKSAEVEAASPNPRVGNFIQQFVQAGDCYKSAMQYDKAISLFNQAVELYRKFNNHSVVPLLLDLVSECYQKKGQLDKAIEYYQQSMEIHSKLNQKADVAISLNNIGKVYYSRGDYDKAIEYYNIALAIEIRFGREAEEAMTLNNIGQVYYSRGEYDKALTYYRQAHDKNFIAKDQKKHEKEIFSAILYNNIGKIFTALGAYDVAIGYSNSALNINREFGAEAEIAMTLCNIGENYIALGEHIKAVACYKQAIEINLNLGKEAEIASIFNTIGPIWISTGEYDMALECYRQALDVNRKLGRQADIAISLSGIGTFYCLRGQYEKSLEHFQKALEINNKLGSKPAIANSLSNIGWAYDSSKQYSKAIQFLHDSIDIKEKLRNAATDNKRDYLASQLYTYQLLISAYQKNNNPQGVLQSIEQSRARLLAERIAGRDFDIEISSLGDVQKGLEHDEAVLIFSNIDRDNFVVMAITNSVVSMKEIPKESVLAKVKSQYQESTLNMLDKQRGLILKAKKKEDQLPAKSIGNSSEFEKAINYYRMSIVLSPTNGPRKLGTVENRSGNLAHCHEISRTLYALLIKPVEDTISGRKKLLIVPDGVLAFLPFETLVDVQDKYLVEKYSVQYIQSMTIARRLNERQYRKDRKPMLAFGGAVYEYAGSYVPGISLDSAKMDLLIKQFKTFVGKDTSLRSFYEMRGMANWDQLPGTMSEVENISLIVSDSEAITGAEATENKVKQLSESGKLADYKILHFAAHGLVVPDNSNLSALILSQFNEEKDGEDGFLRMNEIADLDIKADFVNLSACDTGLGKIYGGEGVEGLIQSFLIAGANGLSVSLWQVADDSTSKFMTELYRKVQKKNISYGQAIAETKRGFIKGEYGDKWKSPYHWAPFVYYGN